MLAENALHKAEPQSTEFLEVTTIEGFRSVISPVPEICPYCHSKIIPHLVSASRYNNRLDVMFRCPAAKCKYAFLTLYAVDHNAKTTFITIEFPRYAQDDFPQNIKDISSSYCKIFNEAYAAEQAKLLEVAGLGYRKAFEILIKDYLRSQKSDDETPIYNAEELDVMTISQCIGLMDSNKLASLSQMIPWLQNDVTCFANKWEEKDVADMKALLNVARHYIESELIGNHYLKEMGKEIL